MMREVYDVPPSNLSKAQDLLGKDDITSRQSIYTRTAVSIGLKEDKTYLIFDGSEDSIKIADNLLNPLATKLQGQAKESILKKFDDIENASAAGFGMLGM